MVKVNKAMEDSDNIQKNPLIRNCKESGLYFRCEGFSDKRGKNDQNVQVWHQIVVLDRGVVR